MRACRLRMRRNGSVSPLVISGGPSPLPLSHPGEGFFQRPSRLARKPDAEPSPGGRGEGEEADGLA